MTRSRHQPGSTDTVSDGRGVMSLNPLWFCVFCHVSVYTWILESCLLLDLYLLTRSCFEMYFGFRSWDLSHILVQILVFEPYFGFRSLVLTWHVSSILRFWATFWFRPQVLSKFSVQILRFELYVGLFLFFEPYFRFKSSFFNNVFVKSNFLSHTLVQIWVFKPYFASHLRFWATFGFRSWFLSHILLQSSVFVCFLGTKNNWCLHHGFRTITHLSIRGFVI